MKKKFNYKWHKKKFFMWANKKNGDILLCNSLDVNIANSMVNDTITHFTKPVSLITIKGGKMT